MISLIGYIIYLLLSSGYSPLILFGIKSPYILIVLSFYLIFGIPLILIYSHFISEHKILNKKKITEDDLKILFSSHELTRREQEIAALVFKGLTNQEIEGELFLSLQTVKNYISSIYQKLGVKNRLDLIHYVRSRIEFL